jgi:hypothetical protein
MPGIRNPRLTVTETVAEPDIGNLTTPGSVPCLAMTVTYEAMFKGMELDLPPGYGFRERISVDGSFVQLSFEMISVSPDGPQVVPREVSALVDKSLVIGNAGPLETIPIQCTITLAAEPDTRASAETNVVELPGIPVDTPVGEAPTVLQRVLTWIERLITQREP